MTSALARSCLNTLGSYLPNVRNSLILSQTLRARLPLHQIQSISTMRLLPTLRPEFNQSNISNRLMSLSNYSKPAELKTLVIGTRSFSTLCKFLNHRNNEGDTPLHLAVKLHGLSSHYETCKLLLENGANPNIPDNEGNTPLDTAIENDSIEMIILLKNYNAVTSQELAIQLNK